MTDEEIKAYVSMIEKVSLEDVINILPNSNGYNVDIIMSRICESLAENINVLRNLNNENGKHELDNDIITLLKKYYICVNYLNEKTDEIHHFKAHKVVFAKTPAGNPYFNFDLDKIPREVYGEVKKVLENILDGVNTGDPSKFKYYNDTTPKMLEFKGFQIRIYTTKLKGNILYVLGLEQKKANTDSKIDDKIRQRLASLRPQIAYLKNLINDEDEKMELLSNNEDILNNIMNSLQEGISDSSEYVELLFPSDEELEKMVPYEKVDSDKSLDDENIQVAQNEENIQDDKTDIQQNVQINDNTQVDNIDIESEVNDSVEEVTEPKTDEKEVSVKIDDASKEDSIPKEAKKVKRIGRGLGKKTIARNEITNSLKGLSLGELMEIQNFITKLKMNRKLNDTIGDIYEGFLSMSPKQVSEFEESIKDFKHDDIGRSI